ncbi:hypothetical protein LCGC14_0607840 [marine sediment metagenome]|uniref:Minor tail T domain-containing protein n=1 Tax=marine sediment metagenome TaxID=412755 RepID=A0A0F9RST1_9ZZZZ
MPVNVMLASMPASEYKSWRLFFTDRPFTQEREDWRIGILAAAIVNMLKSKKGKRAKPSDYIPKWRKPGMQKPAPALVIASKVNVLRTMFGSKAI